jgi:hypothetical protein
MPCTLDGLMAIRRFETAMYDQVGRGPNPNLELWQNIFSSVKNRLLHGAKESTLPGGETKEEVTIMSHVKNFIDRFKNQSFVGFRSAGSVSRTSSPAPGQAAAGANPVLATVNGNAGNANQVEAPAAPENEGPPMGNEEAREEMKGSKEEDVDTDANGDQAKEL